MSKHWNNICQEIRRLFPKLDTLEDRLVWDKKIDYFWVGTSAFPKKKVADEQESKSWTGMDLLWIPFLLFILYLAPVGLVLGELLIFRTNHISDTMMRIAPEEFWNTLYVPVIFILEVLGLGPK